MRSPSFLCALLLLGACGKRAEPVSHPFAPPIAMSADGGLRVGSASRRFIRVERFGAAQARGHVIAPGRVGFRPGAVAAVGAPLEGRITAVHVRLGQPVHRGDTLVTLSSVAAAMLRAEVTRTEVTRSLATTELDRQRQMSERGVGVASDLAGAEARLAEASATLAGLRASAASLGRGRAASTTLRSPIDGVVLDIDATVGQAVDGSSEPLVTVGDPSSVWIIAEVFERDLALITAGSSATLTLSSSQHPLGARVSDVGGSVDAATRRAPVYLALDDAIASPLRSGMFARVQIETNADVAPTLPVSAVLIKGGGRTIVYIEEGTGLFAPRDVMVGHPIDGRVPVLSGLTPGDNVVVDGGLLLDGAADILR